MRVSALWLTVFFLTAFLSVSSGIIASTDGLYVFKVTQALVERGEITISGENIPTGHEEQSVSRFGLGLSLAAIPSYLLGRLVSVFAPESFQSLVLKGSVSLTNVVVSALVCLLLFLTGRQLGYSDRVSLLLTVCFAFTTFFIVYATKSFLTQPLETLCLVGTLYCLIKYSRAPDTMAALYAGGFCGIGILTKWVFLINLPIVIAYLLAASGRNRRARDLSSFALPVMLFLALALGYNYMRFGSIVRTGYGGVAVFSTPLLVGLYGLLFSAGKSLFLYAPIAVLGCVAMRPFGKSHRREMLLLLGLFSANLMISSTYHTWAGRRELGTPLLDGGAPLSGSTVRNYAGRCVPSDQAGSSRALAGGSVGTVRWRLNLLRDLLPGDRRVSVSECSLGPAVYVQGSLCPQLLTSLEAHENSGTKLGSISERRKTGIHY
ncbi:MAG: glycosyltransferase family 39 protein [Candidatus Methylomirabilis sp.]|nr:glycosyltransferase family 39 protein [Candidatus Methylomirabilis sp.]